MIRLKHLLAEVDDNKIIKYKDKDGKPAEMKAGSAKTMEKGHPAKIAWDKENEKGMKKAAKGGDDKKDTTAVSFDRKAGKDDADSKVKDGKLTIGDDSRKEELDVKSFANTLDLPGIDEKTLADKFESGDATFEADDSGRISFYMYDDKLGQLTAEIEDDGTFYFDGDSLEIDEDDKEYLEDSLRGDLDYYHDQFREQDEGQVKLKNLLKK